ncbi:hypothetical protein, partial [Escherichia coli]|uniref:hypothetical protein n=1 Tax=Escherichia coli TaxID=562 RepID=UPI00195D12BE
GYLRKFYETLEILDAGYVSDRKEEAFRLFREIHSVPAIPGSMKEEFERLLKEYSKRSKIDYTTFKSEVLSKITISVDISYLLSTGGTLKPASYLA